MNDDRKHGSVEHTPDDSEGKADVTQSIARFAQYTSPIMLAMLASAGKDAALAATFNN